MIIGRMNKRITLHEPVKTPDGQGGKGKSYEPRGTVWAELRKPKRQIAAANGGIVADVEQEISIRCREDVRRGWRVTYKDRTFDVLDAYPPGKEAVILVCREMVK